jgi:hypothetical protein
MFRIIVTQTLLPQRFFMCFKCRTYSHSQQTLNSLLTITLDESNQIKTHTEEWDHQKTISKGDGFLGMLNEERKKLTANLTKAFVAKS